MFFFNFFIIYINLTKNFFVKFYLQKNVLSKNPFDKKFLKNNKIIITFLHNIYNCFSFIVLNIYSLDERYFYLYNVYSVLKRKTVYACGKKTITKSKSLSETLADLNSTYISILQKKNCKRKEKLIKYY